MTNSNKGFTLIELLVVIVIVGVIGAMIVPRFMQPTQQRQQRIENQQPSGQPSSQPDPSRDSWQDNSTPIQPEPKAFEVTDNGDGTWTEDNVPTVNDGSWLDN